MSDVCRGCPGVLMGDCATCAAAREAEERDFYESENGGDREDD